jgi:hypothetical protein
VNRRFVLNGLLFAVPLAIAATAAALLALRVRSVIGPPPDPTPPPPTITAPRGPLPDGPVAFEEWVRYRGEDYRMVGCGFLMAGPDGRTTVGVTTAHSATPGDPGHVLEWIKLRAVQPSGYALEFDTLYGMPGRARSSDDLAVDYILLRPPGPVERRYVLQPDPRGAPQPGERVSLYKCVGGEAGRQHLLEGTVQSVDAVSVWVLMDAPFGLAEWSGSGSPLLSQHTGQVVGMLIAGMLRGRSLLLGMHPVGSLVDKMTAAETFPTMADYAAGTPPVTSQPLVTLFTDAPRYAAGAVTLHLTLTNQITSPIYLPVCGPWEVIDPHDPERPVWDILCEIDYLGRRVAPGGAFTDSVSASLKPGVYSVRTRWYGDCTLGEPKSIGPGDTYYGEFGDCATRAIVGSHEIVID